MTTKYDLLVSQLEFELRSIVQIYREWEQGVGDIRTTSLGEDALPATRVFWAACKKCNDALYIILQNLGFEVKTYHVVPEGFYYYEIVYWNGQKNSLATFGSAIFYLEIKQKMSAYPQICTLCDIMIQIESYEST